MSSVDRTTRDGLPEFDLAYLYDDPLNPDEVTVFEPDSGALATAWITAEADDAIGLEDVA